jgi:S-layer homology domain
MVTRQELVVMVMNAFKLKADNVSNNEFKDKDNIAPWAMDAVNTSTTLSIVQGYKDSTFGGEKNITRAEMFTILTNCLNKK